MKIVNLTFLCFFLFAFTCKEEHKEEIENQLEEAIAASGGKTAEEWNGKLDQFFTLEMAVEATGYPASEATKEYNQVLKSPETHSMQYKWDKGRIEVSEKIKNPITGKPMEIPTNDYIEVSWVRTTTLEQFKHNYHTPTPEEVANASKAMKEKMQEMQNAGKATAEQASMTNEMATALGEGLSFDEVPNLGTYSVWNNKDMNLKVFFKGLEFQVYANLGSETKNKQACIMAAQLIINQNK
ncbi:MAG: hypothetical protein KA215_02070 [Flavobacterium sp.]|jgi:hypothetical protein|nr:hypothetical protein [Flavobacterium sp.]HQV34942.1 hypothetical protein [Flavobacterium sp.]HQX02837.1 hypothetical protein [Flavobacterium sp.]HRA74245.1 hypothetical protein [Flavobacterium sp.]